MASEEILLISKVVQEKDIASVVKLGIKASHFTPQFEEVWSWITTYWRDHNEVPTTRALSQEFGDLKLADAKDESLSGLVAEVHSAYRKRVLLETLNDSVHLMDKSELDEVVKTLTTGVQKASSDIGRLRDVDLISTWEERVQKYEELRKMPNAIRGIPTGLNGLDRITSGFRPQQLITMVGEAKRGKSLMTLMMAKAAHTHGKRPVFISFEMTAAEKAARWDAIIANVPYSSILRAALTDQEMKRVRDALSAKKNMQPFTIVEDTASVTTLTAVAAKIQELQPDILFVDGVYMMEDENGEPKGSSQALTNITRGMKRLAQRYDIPIVITTQVLSWKLGNKKTRRVTADAIGYTSSFAQDSDLVLAVEADPDIEDQGIIRVVLARSAPHGEIRINWDWQNMDFTEVGEDGEDLGETSDDWYY